LALEKKIWLNESYRLTKEIKTKKLFHQVELVGREEVAKGSLNLYLLTRLDSWHLR
jgi:hypothetical protein